MYAIFLDDSAEIWAYYLPNGYYKAPIFFYPALTGIRVLNGVYTDGTNVYLSNGFFLQNIESGHYGITKNIVSENVDGKTNWVTKQTLEEAIEKARRKNIKYIIYFYGDLYQIIEI